MTTGNDTIRTVERVTLNARSLGAHARGHRHIPAAPLASGASGVLLALMPPLLIAGALGATALVCALLAGGIVAGMLNASYLVRRYRGRTIACAGAMAVICMLVELAIPDARSGIYALYNFIASRYDDVFGAYIALAGNGQLATNSALFGLCFGTLNGVVSWALSRTKHPGITLFAVAFTCAGCMRLHLGFAPIGSAFGIIGWLGQCRFAQLRSSSFSFGPWTVEVLANAVACIALFVGCNLVYTPLGAISDVHEAFTDATHEIRYGHDELPDGNLMQASTMNDPDGSGLELFVDGTVSDDLLLKGFIGANFDGRSWSKLPHTAYEGSWIGMISWLDAKDFTPALQRAAYDDLSADAGIANSPEVATISVNAENAYKGYVYVPYSMRSLSGTSAKLNLGGTVLSGFFGTRTYRFTMDDVRTDQVITNPSWLSGQSNDYADAEDVFSGFVRENNLAVPEEEQAAIERLIFNGETWNGADTSEYAVISRVRTMLSTLASYTESPQTPPGDGSFTAWFLEDARKGNSAYFATVAALALRTQGIPARYVEGYRADADDLAQAETTRSNVVLDGHDVHAWIEVYFKGQGWTPIEVTPGYYSQALNADNIVDVNEAQSNGTGDGSIETGSVSGPMDEDDQENGGQTRPFASSILWQAIGVAAGVLIAAGAAFGQRGVRRRLRAHACASDDQNVAMVALYRHLADIMGESDLAFDASRPLEVAGRFEGAFGDIDEKEYRRAISLHQSFAFGGHTLAPNELRTVRSFNERLAAGLPPAKTLIGKLRRYFVKAL